MPERIPPEVRNARRDLAKLVTQRTKLLEQAGRDGLDRGRLIELDDAIGGLLDEVVRFVDPCDASAAEPLVLLPVRLETRFGHDGQATTLRVRIYPDEIHVDDLTRGLSDVETVAAQAYWTAVWADPVPATAWTDFVTAVGGDRAEWVAHAMTPTNLAERGLASAPAFPTVAATGVRNIVARALPDRFVVVAVQGSQVSRAVGRPVPRDLALSPIPLEGDDPQQLADALAVPAGAEWLVDYDAAVAVGMAVTLELAGGDAPIQRLVALGTRASVSPAAGADELEEVLVAHRFGAGLGLLAQGVPTNNADESRSPFQPRRPPEAPALAPAAATAGSDASAAAAMLGVDPTLVTGLVGDGTGEQRVAGDVNTALWAPGWGEFLSRLDTQGVPGIVDAQRESARGLFRDHVRGRGCAPTLRVGAQPYGVVPVSDLRRWVPQAGETTAGIVAVVRMLLDRWLVAADRRVPRVRTGDPGVEDVVLEVLGSSPVMQGLRVRPVVSDDVSAAVLAALGIDHREYEAERISTAAVLAHLLGADADKARIGSLHTATRPLPLPIASPRDPEFVDALLAAPSRVLAVDSVLQALLALAWQSSELDVAKAAPATVLSQLIDLTALDATLKSAASAMVAKADSASPAELDGLVVELSRAGAPIGGPSMLRTFQPFEHIQTSLAEVALSAPVSDDARLVAGAALTAWIRAMGYRNEVRAAMRGLAGTTVEARDLAVREALDCSSHRLDAWATAVVAQRRARQGAARGLTIGAYGVVLDLVPQGPTNRDGWIYAPSPRHAIAAGMLRSSHLSHLPVGGAAGDGGPFAIDLSSRRMREAAHVIEGVRRGQPIGALVGYQIERRLYEEDLARLQLSLRTIAPLVARRLHDADDADDDEAKEAVAANNVVDGVLLLSLHPPSDPARLAALLAKLGERPKNPYLEDGDWPPLDGAQRGAVATILREAADTLDAVADVMLSESVLQHAGGNPYRAAAAMDAMSDGAAPSDTVDVLEVPDSAEVLTHEVLAIVAGPPPASGWNAARPRAVTEPRLEAWAAAHLGDPGDIVLADVGGRLVTLADGGVCALDLVHAVDVAAFELMLRVRIPDLDGVALAAARDAAWPAAARPIGQVVGLATALRSVLAGAMPLLPDDLVRPSVTPTRDTSGSRDELTARLTSLAAALSAAADAFGSVVAVVPEDGIVGTADTVALVTGQAFAALEPFGVALRPVGERPLDLSWARDAWSTAQARGLAATALVDQLATLPADATLAQVVDLAQDVAAAVFGDGFLVVPVLAPGSGADPFVDAATAPAFAAPAPSAVRRFVRDVATVRPQVSRLSEALLLEQTLGRERRVEVVQLAERGADGPAAGTDRWLAGPLPPEGPWPAASVTHVLVDAVGTVAADVEIAGLSLDSWLEFLPAQPGPKAKPDDPRPGRARTGLAIRCNSASARPPQAILCAVSPDGQRWTTDALRGVIEQTLDLARARLVTLERLAGEATILPALYERSSSLQGQKFIDFTKLTAVATAYVPMPFVKEMR